MKDCISLLTDDQTYIPQETSRLFQLHVLLTSSIVQSLLHHHPNELANGDRQVPSEWLTWQSWCQGSPRRWLELVHYYIAGTQLSPIPTALLSLVSGIRKVQLPRDPISMDALLAMRQTGMSPKKAHEVSRMVHYVLATIKVNAWDPKSLRIVDVGAGQGYLTRALKTLLPRTRILALDADKAQTVGAQRWERQLLPPPTPTTQEKNPSITHKTIHITPKKLFETVDEWIKEEEVVSPEEDRREEIPVLLVGLHACGSLTPDIIRTFGQSRPSNKMWKFAAVVVIGCCYNLMNPGDFPLSRYMSSLTPPVDLPTSAYHLAAQIPMQWLISDSPLTAAPSVELALRKVTWRALLGKKIRNLKGVSITNNIVSKSSHIAITPGRQLPWSRLPETKTRGCDFLNELGTGATNEMRKLGRLKDTAYQDWETFIDLAGKKMVADFSSDANERDIGLEQFLEVVHTLRCLIGPIVESAVVLDRKLWIDEICFEKRKDVKAEIVNLFDQATRSGRNIAIVIAPSMP